jgi:hypothetical protein
MDICTGALAPTLRLLNSQFGWECHPLPDGRALISTGRRFADYESVDLLVRVTGDIVTFSDGGLLSARLADAGFDITDEVYNRVWQDVLYDFRLSVEDGTVHLTSSPQTATAAAARLADGLLALDTLRHVGMPKVQRVRTFSDDVEDYLRSVVGDNAVTKKPRLTVDGMTVQPSLRVVTKRAPVLVQAVATTAARAQSLEHAYFLFSMVAKADVPPQQRLVILGGSEASWPRPRLHAVSDVAYVGLLSQREALGDFLSGQVPTDRLLLDA